MAQLQLEIKKKMDLSGLITYSLYVDGNLTKSSNEISDIQALAQTIKDGFFKEHVMKSDFLYFITEKLPDLGKFSQGKLGHVTHVSQVLIKYI